MNQKNLNWLFELLFTRYDKRNDIQLPSLSQRIEFLLLGIRNLQDAVEDGREDEYKYRLANVFARICCVAGHFTDMDVVKAFVSKYPAKGCSYCDKTPCGCGSKRDKSKLSSVDPVQYEWRLSQFQEHLGKLYGAANEKRGMDNALSLLFSEAAELILIRLVYTGRLSQAEMYLQYGLELADALARLIAVANLLNIDLEAAVLETYEKPCSTCHGVVCTCGAFKLTLDSFETVGSTVG